MNGGFQTLEAACEAVEVNIPVLVFAGSGGAADFIAAAYHRREQWLVSYQLCTVLLSAEHYALNNYQDNITNP